MVPVQLKTNAGVEIDPMLEEVQHESHTRCLALLADVLSTPYFYFSPSGDLTNSKQRQEMQGPFKAQTGGSQGKEAWDRLDQRFVWNDFSLGPFLDVKPNSNDLHAFLMPLVHGAMFIRRCTINRVRTVAVYSV